MVDIAAIVLAAGLASRYRAAGGVEATKLIAEYRGVPLVRWAAKAALASKARPIVVVTGHARLEVEAALEGLDLQFVHNPNFADGLASSLRTGVAALQPNLAGAIVLLGDMPDASASLIDGLIDRLKAEPSAQAAVPLLHGQRGNPVALGRVLFREIEKLKGDEGARRLLNALPPEAIVALAVEGHGVSWDIDTPDDLKAAFSLR